MHIRNKHLLGISFFVAAAFCIQAFVCPAAIAAKDKPDNTIQTEIGSLNAVLERARYTGPNTAHTASNLIDRVYEQGSLPVRDDRTLFARGQLFSRLRNMELTGVCLWMPGP